MQGTSAVERYVEHVEHADVGAPVVYLLRRGCTHEQRLAVLSELRELHRPGEFPSTSISMVGDEIAVFGAEQ